ncbi:hypothetical protein CK203_102043 [Vitis vinifera]|uniref:Uncharacterized protein n=1 Tax=Vitis vinifera TaxID=29760 RepID=A0A438CHC2_VITVI|nr:hypothetical protein CK203_102043 [Vitis vinifera]
MMRTPKRKKCNKNGGGQYMFLVEKLGALVSQQALLFAIVEGSDAEVESRTMLFPCLEFLSHHKCLCKLLLGGTIRKLPVDITLYPPNLMQLKLGVGLGRCNASLGIRIAPFQRRSFCSILGAVLTLQQASSARRHHAAAWKRIETSVWRHSPVKNAIQAMENDCDAVQALFLNRLLVI